MGFVLCPQNAVLGVSRLLQSTPLTTEQEQYVQMINNSGHLLLTIINDILGTASDSPLPAARVFLLIPSAASDVCLLLRLQQDRSGLTATGADSDSTV